MTGNPNSPKRDHWGGDREHVVKGLRDLATFLETHTDLPIPNVTEFSYSVVADTDAQERNEVNRVAEILGVSASEGFNHHHYVATAYFGPVIYRAVAITEEEMQRYRTTMDQIDVIRGEQWPI